MIYLIGSLRNPQIPIIAKRLREEGFDVFDDWHAPGPDTDTYWMEYERARGRSYREALYAPHATDVFKFDKDYLDRATTGVLVMPAGRSGHREIGYLAGRGCQTFTLFEGEPERWDIMTHFDTDIAFSVPELIERIRYHHGG